TFGRPLYAETVFTGVGFGLGFAVVIDPLASKSLGSAGEFNWGGAASTTFWVDPAEQLTATFFTQLMPSSAYPIRPQLRQMVYQPLVDGARGRGLPAPDPPVRIRRPASGQDPLFCLRWLCGRLGETEPADDAVASGLSAARPDAAPPARPAASA